MANSKQLGARISYLLKEQCMTQKELASRVGATEAAISKYIKGEREPRAEILANIATVLHTTSEALLGMGSGIETSFGSVKAICARAAMDMTQEERNELIMTILQATQKRGL
ncbi:MAG: helix-turn-helix transcriptional regulator [Coriobacteriaceae bacterium]|nr:helix-turn-helix transcriptional regulator [Coriobacteriaceae bacterium]